MIAEGVYYSQRKLARKEATMAAMTQDVRELFETAENMVLCTASADGTPNGAAIGMKTVIDHLKERNIRDKYKVMIGGGPVSQKFADEIGADAYTVDAASAVRKMKELKGILS